MNRLEIVFAFRYLLKLFVDALGVVCDTENVRKSQ